ncbi:MAG: acyl-[Lachnospiraceae bacterium]|nr:acyl-[acyl-carrier-protein] thioesterase [Lachnospiraceae bacterium]
MGVAYEYTDTIRYSKVDGELALTVPALVDYFQDAAIEQSEALGVGTRELSARSLAWFMVSWDIRVNRLPKLGERIVVGTFPYHFRGMLGNRAVFMKTEDGETLAEADAQWAMMDTANMRMTRAPEDIVAHYQLGDGPLFERLGRRIEIPENGISREAVPVQEYMLDNNGHVNNGQFVHLAMSYVPKGVKIAGLRVEYKKQVRPGEVIRPVIASEDLGADGARTVIVLATDEPACIVEIRTA